MIHSDKRFGFSDHDGTWMYDGGCVAALSRPSRLGPWLCAPAWLVQAPYRRFEPVAGDGLLSIACRTDN